MRDIAQVQPRQPAQPRMADVPLWQRGLQKVTAPFDWISRNITEPFGAIVSSPFTPATAGTEGMGWLERERAEYKAWDDPNWGFLGVKGALETLPWLAVPGAGGILGRAAGVGVKGAGLLGLAQKGGAIGRGAAMAAKAVRPVAAVEALPGRAIGGAVRKVLPKAKPVTPKVIEDFTDINVYGLVDKHLGDKAHIEYTVAIIGGEKSFSRTADMMASSQAFRTELKQTLKDIGLPEQITVYRGVKKGGVSGEYTNVTLNPEIAKKFGAIKTYTANLKDVVGIGKTNESELLFRTSALKEVVTPIAPAVAILKAAKPTLERTGEFVALSTEEIERQITRPDWLRSAAQRFSRVPAVKAVIEKLAGRAATITGSVEDTVPRAYLVATRVEEALASKGEVMLSTLREVYPDPIRLFDIDTATGIAKNIKPNVGGISTHIADIAEHPAQYALTRTQSDYIQALHNLEDWVLSGLTAEGIVVKELKFDDFSHWVHRHVIGKNIDEALVEVRKGSSRKIGAKASWEKVRFYETAAEGAKKGLVYEPNLHKVAELYVQTAARRIATERASKMIAPLGRATKMVRAEEAALTHPAFQGRVFPVAVRDEIQRYWDDMGWAPLSRLATVSGTMRTLVAAADFSAAFIQGLPMIGLHPKIWAKSVGYSFASFSKPKTYENYMGRNLASLSERAHYGGYVGGFEYTEATPVLQKVAGKITKVATKQERLGEQAVRQTYGRFEASFGSLGDVSRNEMWLALKGRAKNPQELMELARHIDRMTGVMSSKGLGIGKTQRDFEQAFLFFAPRYTRAGFALVGDAFKGGITGAETRKALGFMMAGGAALYAGTAKALGQEPNFDPTSSRFMTIEIADPITGTTRHFGIGGMMTSLVRFGADVVASTVGMGQNEPLDFVKLNRFDNPFIRFMYSKSAPLTGFMGGMLTGENYFGEPFENAGDYAMFIGEQVMPISVQSALMEKGGLAPTALAAQELGLRTFPRSDWEERNVIRNELAQRKFGMSWEDVGRTRGELEQRKLELDSPELKEATQKAVETSTKMARGEGKIWVDWRKEGEQIENYYRNQIKLASAEFEEERNGVAFNERVNAISQSRRDMYARREQDPKYTDVYGYFSEPLEPGVLAKMNPKDLARREYYKTMYDPKTMYDQFGTYRFDEADRREKAFVQKYGQATLDYVEEYMGAKWEEPIALKVLKEAKDLLKPYWEITDRVWSMYPPELKTISDQIEIMVRADPASEKKLMRQYPQILRARELIARYKKMMRDRNPAIRHAYRMYYG